MDQNGSFFRAESLGGEEDEFENQHSSKKQNLQNGHGKHIMKPRNSLHEFEKIEDFIEGENGFAEDLFDPNLDLQSEYDQSIPVDDSRGTSEVSFGRSSSRRRGKSRKRSNGSDFYVDGSFESSRGEENESDGEYKTQNGMDIHGEGVQVRGHIQLSLSDSAPPDEDQDPSSDILMTKYMEETPRMASSGIHSNSHLLDNSMGGSRGYQSFEVESNTNSSNNNGYQESQSGDQYEEMKSNSDNLVSLGREQPPSHLEDAYDDGGSGTDRESEFGETVIPAGLEEAIHEAALNVLEFGSDAEGSRESVSSASLGHFKPVAKTSINLRGDSSSRRSSKDALTGEKLPSASCERVADSAFEPYKETLSGAGDAQGRGNREVAGLRGRKTSRISALNLGDITDSEVESVTPRSKEQLSSRLSEERQSRKQATNVNHQLQTEYDELLAKYAQAENTIDQLRLGAKVNLYSDPPPKGQSSRSQVTPAKQPLTLELGIPRQAGYSTGDPSRRADEPHRLGPAHRRQPNHEDEAHEMNLSIANLAQQIPLLERAIDTNEVPAVEQQALFDQLKRTHAKLEEEYLQRQAEAKEQQRWSSVLMDSEDGQFDPENSLEGKIFQVGMQLEDLQEKVEENLRNNHSYISTPSRHSSVRRQSTHEDIPKKERSTPQVLPFEYNQLLERYETLKQLPGTPRRDRDIQQLVKEIDDLQMTSKDEADTYKYSPERSDVSYPPSTRRQQSRRTNGSRERDSSSGRGTPSSAHSLEERKTGITKEKKQARNSKKVVKPLGTFPTKTTDAAVDSGSSHPRSPEHEVDSGFVGSEGSRQSQKSRQSYIPRSKTMSGSRRLHTDPGNRRSEELRLKRASHPTPIQELSERGQYSSSQSEGRRRGVPSRKSEPVAVSSEDDGESIHDSFERPIRMSGKFAAPSRHQSHQHHIVSPLPSKPKIQDFQKRSETSQIKRSPPSRVAGSSSSTVGPRAAKRERIRSEILSTREAVEPKVEKPNAGNVDPRVQHARNRRNSDVTSSVSKSVKSEALLTLTAEIAGLRRRLRGDSARAGGGYVPGFGERGDSSADEPGYLDAASSDGHETNSVRSNQSWKSERLAELQAEMAQLKQHLQNSGESIRRSGVRAPPSATSTPKTRGRYFKDLYHDEKYRDDPSAGTMRGRDSLRETLRRRFVPSSRTQGRGLLSETAPADNNSSGKIYPKSNHCTETGGSHYVEESFDRVAVDHCTNFQKNGQLSSTAEGQHRMHARMNPTTHVTTSPCDHCNGSGVYQHHAPVGPVYPHQSSPTEQGLPTFVQPSPNRTFLIPNGTPMYHSTPAVVHTPGATNVIQGPPLSHVPTTNLPQQATLGTVIGNTAVVSPQGNLVYTNQPAVVPFTVLSSSPQVHMPPNPVNVSPPQTMSSNGAPPAINVSPPQALSTTAEGATVKGARPVYLVPSSKGRYYIRDGPPVEESEIEEIIYRRTPASRSSGRKSRKVAIQSQVGLEDNIELDETLYAACRLAQRLKRSSEKVVESVQSNLQKSDLRRQLEYY